MLDITQEHQPLVTFIQDFRHHLHRHPELSNDEFSTTASTRAILEGYQIRAIDLPLKAGLVAEIGGINPDEPVVLRSDTDTLPVEEKPAVDCTPQNPGVMHAYGHGSHTSAALGAATLLRAQGDSPPGMVRILLQAAEEAGRGTPALISTGALGNTVVIFDTHDDPFLPVDAIGSKDGALTVGVDRFAIVVLDIGSHAVRPHEGNNSIIITGQVISTLQTLTTRNVPSAHNAVVPITQVHNGSTWDATPGSVWLEGTVRTFGQGTRGLVERRLRQVLTGITAAFDIGISLDWQPGPPSVVDAAKRVDFVLVRGEGLGFEARRAEASPVGEDFAFYQQELSGAFIMIGSDDPYTPRHPQSCVDDHALFLTAHYLSQLAVQALCILSAEMNSKDKGTRTDKQAPTCRAWILIIDP